MKYLLLILLLTFTIAGCTQSNSQKASQNKSSNTTKGEKIGGKCEGCDAIYSNPIPFEKLGWVDSLPDFNEAGPKMVISGTVYTANGKPAKDVVIYVYHTDQGGHYTNKNNEAGYAGSNGYIKGWVKTNAKGQYKFYTLKPASYPGSKIPAHIHVVVKEPGKNEYWIDEFLFDDDPFLTANERKKNEDRGGNGIMKMEIKNGLLYGQRNIHLGKNVEGYRM